MFDHEAEWLGRRIVVSGIPADSINAERGRISDTGF
jgi:hypothetical protein